MPNCQAQIFTARRLSEMRNLTYFALQNAVINLVLQFKITLRAVVAGPVSSVWNFAGFILWKFMDFNTKWQHVWIWI